MAFHLLTHWIDLSGIHLAGHRKDGRQIQLDSRECGQADAVYQNTVVAGIATIASIAAIAGQPNKPEHRVCGPIVDALQLSPEESTKSGAHRYVHRGRRLNVRRCPKRDLQDGCRRVELSL